MTGVLTGPLAGRNSMAGCDFVESFCCGAGTLRRFLTLAADKVVKMSRRAAEPPSRRAAEPPAHGEAGYAVGYTRLSLREPLRAGRIRPPIRFHRQPRPLLRLQADSPNGRLDDMPRTPFGQALTRTPDASSLLPGNNGFAVYAAARRKRSASAPRMARLPVGSLQGLPRPYPCVSYPRQRRRWFVVGGIAGCVAAAGGGSDPRG